MHRGTRRAVLALHLLTAVGWMGLDLGLVALVLLLLLPMALGLPSGPGGTADEVRAAVGGAASRALVLAPVVWFVLLAVALLLSLWKPWGRTPWAPRGPRGIPPPPG